MIQNERRGSSNVNGTDERRRKASTERRSNLARLHFENRRRFRRDEGVVVDCLVTLPPSSSQLLRHLLSPHFPNPHQWS